MLSPDTAERMIANGISVKAVAAVSRGQSQATTTRGKWLSNYRVVAQAAIAANTAATNASIAADWGASFQKVGLVATLSYAQAFFTVATVFTGAVTCVEGAIVSFGSSCVATVGMGAGIDLFFEGTKQAVLDSRDPLQTTIDLMHNPMNWLNEFAGGPDSGYAR